jgi:hypothetical protein
MQGTPARIDDNTQSAAGHRDGTGFSGAQAGVCATERLQAQARGLSVW